MPVKGALRMDAGAVRAVNERSKSLFSAGIIAASGDFSAQDAVQLCDADGVEFGRGLCNYSAAEVDHIKVTYPHKATLHPDVLMHICACKFETSKSQDVRGHHAPQYPL